VAIACSLASRGRDQGPTVPIFVTYGTASLKTGGRKQWPSKSDPSSFRTPRATGDAGMLSRRSNGTSPSTMRHRCRKYASACGGGLRKKTPFLVAVDEERVIGWASMVSSDAPSLRHNGIFGIGLLPEYRGLGLGTKLMAGVLKLSRGRFDSLILDVFGKNKRAQKLYKNMGFKPCGRITRHVKLAYGFDDVVIMEKRLRR
jgi:RimJ/RimL family protein N-acetyltransferase